MLLLAKDAVSKFGDRLVGSLIKTVKYGDWPGGLCRVTEIEPDPSAPEIVFQVRGEAGQGETGVFENEEIFFFGWAAPQ